jgi:hypothetical protein
MRKAVLWLALFLILASAGLAQDATFSKTKYSSVRRPKEPAVNLLLTDSKILIKSKKVSKKAPPVDKEIPYSSIDTMSSELATRHRLAEGETMMAASVYGAALVASAASLGAGAVVMATKTKSHWLTIEYHEGNAKQLTVLHLDKSESENVISTLEAKTGKHIAMLDPKASPFNPTAGSKDVDEVISFGVDQVAGALAAAMESQGCKVKAVTANRIECKRPRGASERLGNGGEKVTATMEAKGEQTRVRIWTGKRFTGRVGKDNGSTPIYQEMMKSLQKRVQSENSAQVPFHEAFLVA